MNKKVREWLESILFAAVIIAVLFVIFWPFAIDGNSMEESFFHRDRIAISRAYAYLEKISRGDFVVCKMMRGGKKEHVLKRVVGVPGDSLEITDGSVYINGGLLTEEYLSQTYTSGEINITLSENEYFVMGDNRAYSYDSRNAGTVKSSDMVGKVLLRWYPFDKITIYRSAKNAERPGE